MFSFFGGLLSRSVVTPSPMPFLRLFFISLEAVHGVFWRSPDATRLRTAFRGGVFFSLSAVCRSAFSSPPRPSWFPTIQVRDRLHPPGSPVQNSSCCFLCCSPVLEFPLGGDTVFLFLTPCDSISGFWTFQGGCSLISYAACHPYLPVPVFRASPPPERF